jgi:hypothetical protein
MMVIPEYAMMLGFSSGIIIQASTAPVTGIRNFQKLRFETFTPGRLRSTNHMENAAAERKLNHKRDP